MNIAAIAGRCEKTLIEASFVGDDVHFIWVDDVDGLFALAGVDGLSDVSDVDLYLDLGFEMDAGRIGRLAGLLPATVMVGSVVNTIAEIGQPFVRINDWPGFLGAGVHELVVGGPVSEAAVKGLYARLRKPCRFVADIPGMVTARVVASIINEAYYTLQEKVSTPGEIDTAMKLGTNYPWGPFEWGQRIGEERVYDLLCIMSEGDKRYKPAETLKAAVVEIKM